MNGPLRKIGLVLVLAGCAAASVGPGSDGGGGSGGSGGNRHCGGGGAAWIPLTVSECETALEKLAAAECDDAAAWRDLKAGCPTVAQPSGMCAASSVRAQSVLSQFRNAVVSCAADGTTHADLCFDEVVPAFRCAQALPRPGCDAVTCNDTVKECFADAGMCRGSLPVVVCEGGVSCRNY